MTNDDSEKQVADEKVNELSEQELQGKAFRIALEMVAVFGIPAASALLLGGWLEEQFVWPAWTTYALLAAAFVLSWVIVFIRVQSFAQQLDASRKSEERNHADNTKNN